MIRWTDLSSLDELLNVGAQLDRALTSPARRETGFPRLNLYECDAGFELVAALPGVAAGSLDLTIERDTIRLTGERKIADLENAQPVRRERARGAFARELSLPAPIATDRVEAKLKDGILRVTLPKAQDAQPRKIEIRSQ